MTSLWEVILEATMVIRVWDCEQSAVTVFKVVFACICVVL